MCLPLQDLKKNILGLCFLNTAVVRLENASSSGLLHDLWKQYVWNEEELHLDNVVIDQGLNTECLSPNYTAIRSLSVILLVALLYFARRPDFQTLTLCFMATRIYPQNNTFLRLTTDFQNDWMKRSWCSN